MADFADDKINESNNQETDWDIALREAAEWSVSLTEAPDDPLLNQEFSYWLTKKNINQKAWSHMSRVSDMIFETKDVILFPNQAHKDSKYKKAVNLNWRAIAASVVIALGAIILAPQISAVASGEQITKTAEQKIIPLDDGSSIRLAPQSSVKIEYSKSLRQVKLIKGEAFFEVAHDSARPFQIVTSKAIIKDIGTGFNIRLGKSDTVGVKHGIVAVNTQNSNTILKAGQWARIGETGNLINGTSNPQLIGNWSAHYISANNRNLGEVVEDLNRYYDGKIIVTNKELAQKSITGVFETTDTIAAARLIARPHNGVVRRITPWLLVISAN